MFESKDVPMILNALYSLLGIFTLTWIISVIKRDIGLVDITWGFGYAVQTSVYYSYSSLSLEVSLYAALFILHGLRLAIYLIFRNCKTGEDKRYQMIIREKFGNKTWWVSYLLAFLPQSLINFVVGLITYSFINSPKLSKINHYAFGFGLIVMLTGTLIESIADFQLYCFKRNENNKGKLLKSGLWRLSKHPNYIGEVIFFWGAYFTNLSIVEWIPFFSPIIMTFLIRYISGVPILEKIMKEKYKDQYENNNNNQAENPIIS